MKRRRYTITKQESYIIILALDYLNQKYREAPPSKFGEYMMLQTERISDSLKEYKWEE